MDTSCDIMENNNKMIISYEMMKKSIIMSSTINKCKNVNLEEICSIDNNIIISRVKRIIGKYIYYYLEQNTEATTNNNNVL